MQGKGERTSPGPGPLPSADLAPWPPGGREAGADRRGPGPGPGPERPPGLDGNGQKGGDAGREEPRTRKLRPGPVPWGSKIDPGLLLLALGQVVATKGRPLLTTCCPHQLSPWPRRHLCPHRSLEAEERALASPAPAEDPTPHFTEDTDGRGTGPSRVRVRLL